MFGIPAKISSVSVSVLPSVPLAKTNSDTNFPKGGGGWELSLEGGMFVRVTWG